jgi:glycosyltransferase involved in cell wall biosynthesis
MAEVDLVAMPTTFYEGLPIVMCEAISQGVPVVAYDGGGLREMKDLHPGLVVISANVERLKEQILRLTELAKEPGFKQGLRMFYFRTFANARTLDWWGQTLSRLD